MSAPVLLDVTRLISRSWTGRHSTGIDRVCYAYLDRFADRAHAVVQYRGVHRVLCQQHSQTLFAMLRGPDRRVRGSLLGFAARALGRNAPNVQLPGAIYLNVSHTEFDLQRHIRWTRQQALRPVYLIHDLIPITHADYCRPHAITRHKGRVVNALHHAAGIIVNSRSTADDLTGFAQLHDLPVPPLLVASLAGAALPLPPPGTSRPQADPYFLCIGTVERRKNHGMLMNLWSRLIASGRKDLPDLVIIGQWGVNSARLRAQLEGDPELCKKVRVLDQVPDSDLAGWTTGARALLLPTLAEGFGLPMLEALALKTPVVASDLPCFREIGQGIPTLLDPLDADAWQAIITGLGPGSPEYSRQARQMHKFKAPRWDDHFASVESWLAALPARGPSSADAERNPASRPVFSFAPGAAAHQGLSH